ncbi:UNVERIFIED_CONTAM: hypothetical protein GTU68_034172 [Idotea baltica]|nr:hypothetical protein [Idotea baltica]
MRPRQLSEFVGQQHLLGEGRLLKRMLDADRLGSIIFYGPPGTGKTSLASLIAKHTKKRFRQLNATMVGVKDVRALLAEAEQHLSTTGTQTVVFIDELHRFSRSQQDILLPDVESGTISLIGATTANPFFALVAPLISRSQIFEFALIKSIRGSDPDASLYWLARMLESGEDPRFIARRLVISASEDIGNADPQALLIATAVFRATEVIGMPECRINLSQATTYLACAKKSNAAYTAIDAALNDVRTQTVLPVPMHLRDAHYKGAESLGHGKDYQYAHDHPERWVAQDYLGVEKSYYQPVDRGKEAEFKQWTDFLRSSRSQPET